MRNCLQNPPIKPVIDFIISARVYTNLGRAAAFAFGGRALLLGLLQVAPVLFKHLQSVLVVQRLE